QQIDTRIRTKYRRTGSSKRAYDLVCNSEGMETLRRTLLTNPMALVWPAVIFVATLAIGYLVRQLVMRVLRAWTARTQSRGAQILTEALRGPILIWMVILAAHLALQASELPVKVTDWGTRALLVLWIVSLTIMFVQVAGKTVRYYGDQ